jgi:ribose transport system permease protein
LAAAIVAVVVFSVMSSNFLTGGNVTVILLSVAVIGMIAVPGAMLLVSGNVDFAVGSIAVLSSTVFGQLAGPGHVPIGLAAVAALFCGALWGALTGTLVTKFKFSPMVVTLGGFGAGYGIAEVISQGQSIISFSAAFNWLGNGQIAGVPVPVVIFLLTFAGGFYVWYLTPFGRHMTAMGADQVAGHSLGLHVNRLPFSLYVWSGLLAALGGLIETSQLGATSLSIGTNLNIEVLSAILIGGVAWSGGRGSLWGVLWGVLFIGVIDNGLVVTNISPYASDIAVGLALVAAAGADVLYRRLEAVRAQMLAPGEG